MGNILQNSLDVTYEDFLKGVFGARPKPERNALKSLFSEIVTGKSTLVSDLSKPLRANASKVECKRAQERVSGWLGNYDFICVSLVGADYSEALPVYVKLGRGRKGHDELIREAIKAVMERTGGKGWIVEDRGMDGAEHLWTLKRDDRRAVVRVNKMDRDVFGDGLHIDVSLQSAKFFDAMLHVHTGDQRVKIRYKPGVVQYCKDPR